MYSWVCIPWKDSLDVLTYCVNDRCICLGSQQSGAFQPGNTTLRNPTVQPDVSYLSHRYPIPLTLYHRADPDFSFLLLADS